MKNDFETKISAYLRLAELCGLGDEEKKKQYMKQVEKLLSETSIENDFLKFLGNDESYACMTSGEVVQTFLIDSGYVPIYYPDEKYQNLKNVYIKWVEETNEKREFTESFKIINSHLFIKKVK